MYTARVAPRRGTVAQASTIIEATITASNGRPGRPACNTPRAATAPARAAPHAFRNGVPPTEGDAPFQYIITTTEPPPDDVKTKPWLLDPVLNATEGTGRLLGVDL